MAADRALFAAFQKVRADVDAALAETRRKEAELRAKEEAEAEKLYNDALLLAETGCFGIVLEKIPAALAGRVASAVKIPIIGIGAGNQVDGQVLVSYDMLGINNGFSPRFLRRYLNLHEQITAAVEQYREDVKSGDFPNESEQY